MTQGSDWNEMVRGFIHHLIDMPLEVSEDQGREAIQMSRAIAQQMSTWDTHHYDADMTLIPILKAAMDRFAPSGDTT